MIFESTQMKNIKKDFPISVILLLSLFITLITPFFVLAASFSDVPPNHFDYEVIEFLKTEGIISGYPDGTFQPDHFVNRAEALKMVLTAKKIALKSITSSSFKDVTVSDWFAPYIETAKSMNIVSGNPDGTFAPARHVNKVELLKMLLLTYDLKFVNYQAPDKPLYKDTPDSSQWFIPYLDFSKNVNIITPDSNNHIYPAKDLTRAEVAEIIYKLVIITKGGPTQLLLSRAEAALMQSIFDLQDNQLDSAAANVKKAGDLANQALQLAPEQPIVQAAVKVISAFDELVKAFKAASIKNFDQALQATGTAYNLAETAKNINISVENLSNQVKSISQSLAESIRNKQAATPVSQ